MATVAFTTRANLVGGLPENIADVTSCLDALLAGVNSVADAQLASPNNAVWRTYRSQGFWLNGGLTPSTCWWPAFAGSPIASGGTSGSSVGLIHIPTLTDFTVAGKTAQGRVLVHSVTNAVASGVALSFGLYPVSGLSGGAGVVGITLGAAVAGSAVTLTPLAVTSQQAAGTAFTLPSGSSYLLGVQWATTTLAAGSLCTGTIDLQVAFT